MVGRLLQIVLLVSLTLLFPSGASGQARDTASLFGTVTDAQGAVIPGARVTVVNPATGLSRTAATDASGAFVFSLLPVGVYSLTVEQTGFRKYERPSIQLQANENVQADAAMQVGNVQETVTVDAQASLVDTRSATLNHVVTGQRIVELPLNGRNPADLIFMAPGVASGAANNSGDVGGDQWRPKGQKEITVNGSRNNNLRYTLDGGTNMDDLTNSNLDFPFPNAVQEFSAQTSNMGVEQGGLSGGALNVVTKSGTNQVHGDAFWFIRNTSLNATNFFSRQQDQLKRNQFGFTLGGPFVRNKLFGFAGVQRLTIRQAPGNIRDQTLTAAERRGDFSGTPIPIFDPLSGQRFPNNMIPSSRFSPTALKLLSLSPLPDSEGFVRYIISQPENGIQGIGKLDYVLNDKHSLVFRIFESDGNTPYHSPPDNIHAARYGGFRESRSATLGHTWVMSPTTVVHTQFTGAHQLANIATDFPLTTADLGVALTPMGNHIDIAMTGSGVSYSRPLHAIRFGRGSLELLHDWNKSVGNHNLVWGMSFVRKRFNNNTQFHSSGQFQFDGHVTGSGDQAGFDRADFMLGGFSFFTQNSGEIEQRRGSQTGWYIGDTWRVRPGFTLNLGIRYEPYSLFGDELDRNQTFDLAANQAGTRSTIFKNALPGLFYRGDKRPPGYGGGDTFGRVVTDPDYNNFAPRIGFAWSPSKDGKTSIRGGYAMFFDEPSLNAQNDANNVTPFSYSVEFTDGSLDRPFAGREALNIFPASAADHNVPFPTPLFTIVLDKKFITPYTHNWSLTFEREVVGNFLVRVGYVGTAAIHLKSEYDQNAPIYNPNLTLAQNRADIDGRRPVKDFQTISRWMHGLNSSYHGLQLTADKRYSHGVTIGTSYTWSKNLDYVSRNGFGGSRGINNPFNFFFSRGNSDLARTHRFVNSFVWDLPRYQKGSTADAVLGNWRFSAITSLQSGRPFGVGASNNPTAGAGSARADLVGSGYPVLDPNREKGAKIDQYFDKTRFANPAPNTFGTLGRNVLFGPGFANIDTSLAKDGGWASSVKEASSSTVSKHSMCSMRLTSPIRLRASPTRILERLQVRMATHGSYKWRSKSAGEGGQPPLSRRFLLGSLFASLLRGAEAELSNFDLSLLDDPIVPRELFFVREHFPAPVVSSAGWKLRIRGSVAKPTELSYDEMSGFPKKVLPATLECAENAVGGGLVSHAEWTGCSFGSILDKAQAGSDARYVRLSGADGFSRTIPIAKAMHADTLIAFGMNGEKLPVNHGFPLRALIPGWYGMDSVKWLREIAVLTEDDGSTAYMRVTRSLLTGNRPSGRVTVMNVKSAFARPVDGATFVSRRFTIRGAAWAGENRVQRVEISTDNGKVWHGARLDGEPLPYSWALWTFDWKIPAAGSYELCVRAYDDQGRQQPAERPADRADNYELNTYQTVRVMVR